MKKSFKVWSYFLVPPFLVVPLLCPITQANQAASTDFNLLAHPINIIQEKSRPLYYDRLITNADLKGRTLRELTLMRNTIYARAGNPFRKKWLRDYFTAQSWYKPAAKMDASKLSAIDKKNAATIVEYENQLPAAELEARRQQINVKLKSSKLSTEDNIELQLLLRALGETPQAAEAAVAADPITDTRLLDKLLTVDQLSDFSRRDLRILRNTIYARKGREFKSPLLQEYFGRLEWYHPDDKYTDAKLSDIDKRNIKIIMSVENELGGPLTEAENQKEDGWFSQA